MAGSLLADRHVLKDLLVRPNANGTLTNFAQILRNTRIEKKFSIGGPSVELEQLRIVELAEGHKLLRRIVDLVATLEQIEPKTMACKTPLLPRDIRDGTGHSKSNEREKHERF